MTRPLFPWLHVIGITLTALYTALWFVEIYLFLVAFLAGALLFGIAWIAAYGSRLVRGQKPWIDRAGWILLAAMIMVHLAALALMRTINWC